MSRFTDGHFPTSQLRIVQRVEDIPGTSGRLFPGWFVKLNSGSPPMVVLETDDSSVLAATREGGRLRLPRACFASWGE